MLAEIRKMRNTNPALVAQIEIIERFLAELEQFILFPRIVQVPKEVIVEKIVERERIVQLPTQDERSIKMELTLSMLVEKLILELKKIKKTNPSLNLDLEDDIKMIFFSEIDSYPKGVDENFNRRLKEFSDSIYRKFESLGNWSLDHQLMLNTFLQERFMMANLVKNANTEIEKVRSIELGQEERIRLLESEFGGIREMVMQLRGVRGGESLEINGLVEGILGRFSKIESSKSFIGAMVERSFALGDLQIADDRIKSLIRQKDAEINLLKDQITKIQTTRVVSTVSEGQGEMIRVLQTENLKLKNEINELRSSKGSEELVRQYREQVREYEVRILALENEKSDLTAKLSNLQREYEVKMQLSKQFADITFKGESKIEHLSSPVNSYNILNSPEQKITMVESQIKNVSDTPGGSIIKDNRTSADRSKVSNSGFSASYRSPSESESISSSVREGFTSTAKYGATSMADSSKLGAQNAQSTIYNSGYNMTSSQSQQGGLASQFQQGTYQATGGLNRYEPSTYQSSSGSSLQSGSYQTSTTPYQTNLGASGFQAGSTYQGGNYQSSTSGSFQSSSIQQSQTGASYKPYQPSSGTFTSPSLSSGMSQLPKPADKK
jgi:hypothetical protein